MSLRVFIVAGEPSGDRLGGALMQGLNTLQPDVTYQGVGGVLMQAAGLTSQFPMDELSVMGIAEVLPKYRHLKRRISEVADAVIAMQPDVLITIDSPDFCLRVAKLVKDRSDIRTVHYVAPTVWAWRPKRAQKMARFIDQVLAILPFEPPYMHKAGIQCDFVGHPVVAESVSTDADVEGIRAELGLGEDPYIVALPGSRKSEVSRLAPVFGPALRDFIKTHPEFRVVLPAAGPVVETVKQQLDLWPEQIVVLDPRGIDPDVAAARKRAVFKGAEIALAASGTVSLELAASKTPMVIAYTFNWLTWQMMKRMALIDTVTLVNLVSDTRVVSEFLGPDCTPTAISAGLTAALQERESQDLAMELTMERLGQGGEAPGLRAARAVLAGL